MGHDIYARRVDEATLHQEHSAFAARTANVDPKTWLAEYDKYSEAVNVAYLRRSAFDENNSLIYQALDCMDLYAGCSGVGMARTFTRQQVEAAYESLAGCARGRERSHADDLVGVIAQSDLPHETGGSDEDDRAPEYEFLRDVLAWMDAEHRDTIEIDFG